MSTAELHQYISDEYAKQQQQLHADRDDYGVASVSFAPMVANVIMNYGVHTLVDYGCGKARLGPALSQLIPRGHTLTGSLYDPGVEKFARLPEPAEMVVCIDVLEHVEPDRTEAVLDHIASLAKTIVLCTISLHPAAKTLPDGRNAHINLMPAERWMVLLLERFKLVEASINGPNLIFLGGAQDVH